MRFITSHDGKKKCQRVGAAKWSLLVIVGLVSGGRSKGVLELQPLQRAVTGIKKEIHDIELQVMRRS